MPDSSASLASTPQSDLPPALTGKRDSSVSVEWHRSSRGAPKEGERRKESEQRLQQLFLDIGLQQQAFLSSFTSLLQRLQEEVRTFGQLRPDEATSKGFLLPCSTLASDQLEVDGAGPGTAPRTSASSEARGGPSRTSHGSEGDGLGGGAASGAVGGGAVVSRRVSEASFAGRAQFPAVAPEQRLLAETLAAAMAPMLEAAVRRIEDSARDTLALALSPRQALLAHGGAAAELAEVDDSSSLLGCCGTSGRSGRDPMAPGKAVGHFLGAALGAAASAVHGRTRAEQQQLIDATKQTLLGACSTPTASKDLGSRCKLAQNLDGAQNLDHSNPESPRSSPARSKCSAHSSRSTGVQGLLRVVRQTSEDGSPAPRRH